MKAREAAVEIATYMGISEEEIMRQALVAFLQEKKRSIMRDRLEILARYNVTSVDELERKIATGELPEHPAWEDTIVAENLTTRVTEIDRYLKRLQEFGQARN
jgi:hypothetical protein